MISVFAKKDTLVLLIIAMSAIAPVLHVPLGILIAARIVKKMLS